MGNHIHSYIRKISFLILAFVFFLPAATSFAQTAYSNTKYDAMSYMLVSMDNGQVLAQHDAGRKIYPASTTKLMTALLLMEKKGLDGKTTVGTEINGLPSGSSLMRISVGETITIKDLFYGLMLCSGNDSACTIATYVSGSVDSFIALMNQRAAELGMTGTHFTTPYGAFLNQDETAPIPEDQLGIHQYSTASDMAKLTLAAAKIPEILKAGNTGTYTLSATNKHQEERVIENSNPLVHNLKNHPEFDQFYYAEANGLKTGTVSNIVIGDTTIRSYGNVVATAKKGDLSLIALVFDDRSEKSLDNMTLYSYKRWLLAADLFEYGFANYSMTDIKPYIDAVTLIKPAAEAQNGSSQPAEFEIASQSDPSPGKMLLDSAAAQSLQSGTAHLEKEFKIADALEPTVQVGDKVGTVTYTFEGTEVYTANLVVTGQKQQAVTGKAFQADITGQGAQSAGLPGWLLWVLIPVGGVAAVFLIREINIYRRRQKRRQRYQGINQSRGKRIKL